MNGDFISVNTVYSIESMRSWWFSLELSADQRPIPEEVRSGLNLAEWEAVVRSRTLDNAYPSAEDPGNLESLRRSLDP